MSFTNTTHAAVAIMPAALGGSVGFKDWAIVCDALGQGHQSLILRKGGIAEGREGFRFKHESFFLFPTQYHQQAERVRLDAMRDIRRTSAPPEGVVEIRYFFALEWALWIDNWSVIDRLKPFHVWRDDVVRERFDYDDQPGLQCAFGRVYRLEPVWTFPDRSSYGGCRSWVTLPEHTPARSLIPVLDDAQHEAVSHHVRGTIQSDRFKI